jgi:hypothetical protein
MLFIAVLAGLVAAACSLSTPATNPLAAACTAGTFPAPPNCGVGVPPDAANPSCQGVYPKLPQLPNAPDTFGVTRAGTPTKLYQLLGEIDRQLPTPQPTPLSASQCAAGVIGADLGFSFMHKGRLVFLFGDTIPTAQAASLQGCCSGAARVGRDQCCTGTRPWNADTMAFVDDPDAATGETPIPLRYPLAPDGFYQPVTLDGNERCANEVPESGFSDGTSMYVFYHVDDADCRGYSVLAVSSDDGPTLQSLLTLPFPMSDVAPRVVATADVPGLAAEWSDPQTVLMWGRWRVHPPILAAAPLGQIRDASTWRYYAPTGDAGASAWSTNVQAAPQVYTPQVDTTDASSGCRGPFTVILVAEMGRWLVIEQCIWPTTAQIQVRVAQGPIGPWSPPIVLYDMNCDQGVCHYMHKKCLPPGYDLATDSKCAALAQTVSAGEDAGPEGLACDVSEGGAPSADLTCCDTDYTPFNGASFGPCAEHPFPYGAFPMEPLSTWDASSSTLTLYSLMSTFNPYTAVVMKEQLALTDAGR